MKFALVAGLSAFLIFGTAMAASPDDAARHKIAEVLKLSPDDVSPSPIPGIYQVKHEHQFAYVSADGRYLLQGDLVDLKTGNAVTENERRADRRAALAALGNKNMIEFAPKPPIKTKYVVTVFTDVDCGYCRLLHSYIHDYNAKGIEIRYAFFPRSGPDTSSWYRAESVWCSDDRKAALTNAKLGQPLPRKTCPNPIAREYRLGRELGVNATPAMVMPDGELILGFVMPDELAAHLADGGKPATVSLN